MCNESTNLQTMTCISKLLLIVKKGVHSDCIINNYLVQLSKRVRNFLLYQIMKIA